MKKPSKKNNVFIVIVSLILFFTSSDRKENHTATNSHADHETRENKAAKIYTCPMHPEIIRHAPGQCPICGMDLVEKGVVNSLEKLNLGAIIEPVNETVIGQIRTTKPFWKSILGEVRAKGYISYNPKNIFSISSPYEGRIEKLYVKFSFQEVYKGQKIMDIYSPELLTAQQEYIYLLNSAEEVSLINASRQKLLLLGMDEAQIQKLAQTRKTELLFSVYATTGGHIHQMDNLNELTMPTMPMSNNNSGKAMSGNTSAELSTREGMYVKKGESIFNIIGLSDVWVILKIYPEDVLKVKLGQEVKIISEIAPDNPLTAKISYIEPMLDVDSKFSSVRVYIEKCDHHLFKVGSFVSASISTGEQKGLWVPSSSILDLGNENFIVFKKENFHFKSFKVIIGGRVNDNVNIVEGLTENETIASDAWYLVDSESFVVTK
ncbi:MAG TPA: efflux RND transporter periplasmic adaptor subunit [Cytophagaceae bacterium]|nr:efflux RND transporter periplasmic adaptor subunit [Cytophagaceae bacterium]